MAESVATAVHSAWVDSRVARRGSRTTDDPEGERIERYAPGFRGLIRHREVQSPRSLEADDGNLLLGDKSLGSAQLHQQLVFRPRVSLGRAETPVPGLYLASASAHPGGGVHGACCANAASASIAHDRLRRLVPRRRG